MRDDRYDMQVAVFVRWANSLAGGTVRELSDIVDTKFLSIFVQLITGDSFISSGSRIQDISNALRLIDSDECFSQINISELIDGNPRVICSIVWQLIQVFWRRFAPADVRDQKMVEALKDWCAERAQRFGVQINDFISSWRDGYALNAILLSYNPELFNMNQIKDMRAVDRIEHAMSLAKRDFSTPRLLQPKDFSSEHLDKKSVVCYLMVLYLSLLTEVPSSESELEPQPFEQPTESLESSKSSQSSMITRQKIAVKSNSQSMIDSVSSSGETIQTEIEYPLETNLEQIPSTSSSRRQSQQTSENFEIQSCKSSTSSQKSARRHGKSMEETIVEFEECLEHVLAWLLEAEEQANCMKSIEKDDVELVKSLFKEHEMFMQSLTESQDGVGRVLHRGQQLVQKMEEEEAAAIVSQLLMVNTKWERIREISMLRQNQLQHCLNSIQIEQLESIRKWLDSMEEEIKNAPPLTMNGNEIRQLIDTHAAIQNRIENEQKIVRGLSTFVAVVDESDSHFSYENLEKLLQSVGQRWMNVCEWAEMRARQLNGLSELIPQYTSAYHKILESLDNWEGDMGSLRTTDELKEENEVVDQVCRIQKFESSLQKGHPDFVHLSQLAVELISKLDNSNEEDANQIRQQIETVTQRWDNIVARIDEHSHMLVRSGKAEARQLRSDDGNKEDYGTVDTNEDYCLKMDNQLESQPLSTVQFTPQKTIDPIVSSSPTPSVNTVISSVDVFIANVNQITEELKPLLEWTYQIKITRNPNELQSFIQICQDKLKEIKEKEVEVNTLREELDRIHNSDISISQLQLADDSFQNFTQIWSDITTKISDALNSISMQSALIGAENDEEMERITKQLIEFFEKSESVVSNCAQISLIEREERVTKLQKQLQEQDENIRFLEVNHSNKEQIGDLKKRLAKLKESVEKLIEKNPIIECFENYLRSTFPCAGDISTLTSELERCDELLKELENLNLKNPKVERLKKLGNAKRASLADYLERSHRNDEKTTVSENMLSALTDRFAALKSAKLEVPELYKQFTELQKDIQKGLTIQKESITLNEEIMLITLSSSASSRDRIFQKLKNRMQLTVAGWSTLEDDIDESIALLEKEIKRLQQSAIREFQRNLDKLRGAIDASRDATDAEEFSEHLYNLEHLYETMETADKELENLSGINERIGRDLNNIREQRHDVLVQAKERIEELEAAIHNCEQFDSSLTECQAWCNHVQLILSCRAANDVSAFDVPHEYKTAFSNGTLIAQLQKEFDDFEYCIRDLREFVIKNTSDWGTPNRLQLQLDHITNQFEDLLARFVEFKQPVGLEEQAERLSREISDMENSVDELTGVQAESCKQALDHTNEITRRLAMARTHLKELTESGKMFTKEQILTPTAAQILNQKVSKLDEKLKNLSTRNSDMAERMQNCIASLDALNNDMKKLDAVFESVESRLSAFVQSENIETVDADRSTLEELLEDLNNGALLLSKGENVMQRLAMDSFKVDESIIEQRKRRVVRLQGDLRSWIDAIKCVSEDTTALLQKFETLYNQLKESLTEMEQIENVDMLLAELDRCRSDKNLFIERYRRLLRSDPETETKFSVALSEIEKRWNEMEKKCQKTRSSSPSRPALPQLRHDTVGESFRDQISLLHYLYKTANDYLDFERFPVSSVSEWSKRVQDVDEWLVDYTEKLKGTVEEGRRMASSGRMELDVHDALGSLDGVVNLSNQVEGALKENKTNLIPVQAKAETLERDISAMCDILDNLLSRDLSESTIANATQRDLLDRQTQLNYMQRRSDDLHSCLPGTSINQPNTTMDQIHDKIRDLEEKIDAAIKKSRGNLIVQTDKSSEIIQLEEQKESDVISTTSTSLTLEVQEAEDDQSHSESKKESNNSEPLVMAMKINVTEASESLTSLYIEMDEIEKELNRSDPLPFKDLYQKKQKLEEMNESFKKVERAIGNLQMTMDLMENEAVLERLRTLQNWKDRRSNEINELIKAENSFEESMETSQKLLDEIDKALAEIDNRKKSPELEELEHFALSLEDRLQRALAQIQHTSLKAEPILTQIDEEEAARLRDRLRNIGEQWKQYENLVREKRRRFDERFANESELNNEMELLQFWCDETEAECAIVISPLNLPVLKELSSKLEERLNSYERKHANLQIIERLKDYLISTQMTDPTSKHRIRRAVSEIGKRISSIRGLLRDRKLELESAVNAAENFHDDLNKLQKFCERTEKAIQLVESATIFVPSGTDLDYVRLHQAETDEIAKRVEQEWKDSSSVGGSVVDDHLRIIVEDTLCKWSNDKEKLAATACLPTLAHDSSSITSEAIEEEELTSGMQTVLSSIAEEKESHTSEYGTLNGSMALEESVTSNLSSKDRLLMDNIVHIGHWLMETERDASLTVDLADSECIRNAIVQMQTFIDQLKMRHLDLIRILDESRNKIVRERSEVMTVECNKILGECQGRKMTLTKILEESRIWDKLRKALTTWLTNAQEKVIDGSTVDAADVQTLKKELSEIHGIAETAGEMKLKMDELNERSNALLDNYRADEGHNLSHTVSKLNALWSKFNDNVRIRRAVLEAALRTRSDFHSALEQLEEWMNGVDVSLVELNEITMNTQTLKDFVKRKKWIEDEKSVRADINAHKDVIGSVEEMGAQLTRRVEDTKEREQLKERLSHIDIRWRHLVGLADAIRTRLMNAQEEWEKLFTQIAENLFWAEAQSKALLEEQPVGGSLARVQEQTNFIQKLEHEMKLRQRDVDECVTLAHSYLMQHDLRPRMKSTSTLTPDEKNDDQNAELRRVGIQIKSDSDRLVEKWSELRELLNAWACIIRDANAKMEKLASAIAECQLALSNMDERMEQLRPIEKLRLEELTIAVDESEQLKEYLSRTRMYIDDANDWSGQLLASDVELASELSAQLRSINDRMTKLKLDLQIRAAALERAMTDFGPSSQHFLRDSVQAPWQRAVSASNHLPYYINHGTEVTQWDHPAMVEIMEELTTFNQVKFSAYRTAMKLRAIQKRLCLDLITLEDVDSKLQTLNSMLGEQCLSMKDAVICLVPLFEAVQEKYPNLIHSIPLAVDLLLNFVLNVFDPARDCILRTFSFRVLLVTLCNSNLEDKYRYLYQLIANNEGVDHKKLALLLYDIIHIPRFFGEAAAFGGSNVEPSVRSCFETAKYPRSISIDEFLNWLKKEPQSIVWLPVMHRLASAEFAKHQAKCNVCKMFPIIGLRYRCLRCFNVDVCQNCFFSQRLAKNHKLSHPIQEYCLPTTSGEDVRDFGLIVRNKLRSKSKTRIGYLPVQTVDEGPPLESTNVAPVNPFTEPIHNRVQLCARRLWRARGEDDTPIPALNDAGEEMRVSRTDLKSPLQLLSQVEQMHKEELDQVLHKLQHENRELKKEIQRRRKLSNAVGSTPNLTRGDSAAMSRSVTDNMETGRSVPSLSNAADDQLLREAYLLRQHKERLEQRSRILEEQNRQLETQLARLRTVIAQQQNVRSENKENGGAEEIESSVTSAEEDEGIEYDKRPNRMNSLIASVDQLGRAMQSFVVSVVNDDDGTNEDEDELAITRIH